MLKSLLLFLAIACAIPASHSAGSSTSEAPVAATNARLPDTPAGREFGAWLDAFNGHDLDAYRDYIARRSPALTKYIQNDYDFALAIGRFSTIRVDEGDDYALTGLLAESYADFPTRFSIRLDPAPPHHILELDLGPAKRPADMPLPVLDEKALIRALEHRLDVQSKDDRFSGVVLLARGDRILFERAYGFADAEKRKRNTLDTRFGIASMGKMFTATAVMQLARAGKLDLHAPLAKVLPDYPNADIAQNVTLHHLLTHTGGTGDIFVPEIESRRDRIHSHADYIAILGDRAPEFAPGAKWSYSNYGFVLLGRAIERASGEDYFDYVRKHVFAPAGMRHSGTTPLARRTSPRANGYTRRQDSPAWRLEVSGMPDVPSSAGGDLSTARDLYRFARALQTGTLLDAADVETMTRGKVDAPFGSYAYGFKDQTRDGLRYIGHGGSGPGSNSELDIYPDSGYIVIVLTNQDPPYGNRVAEFIGHRLAPAGQSNR
mgnify:CR=1 FL=1